MIIKNTYKLTCRHCSNIVQSSPKICKSCGPILPIFNLTKEDDDTTGSSIVKTTQNLICPECSENLATPLEDPTRSLCEFCSESDLDWYDTVNGSWLSDPVKQIYKDQPGKWLKGNFEGYFESSADSSDSIESMGFNIYKGKLTNLQVVDGPHIREIGEVRPLLQNEVSSIEATTGTVDSEPYTISLVDFQLYQWTRLDSFESRDKKNRLFGKIYGIAYGKLLEIPDVKELPEETLEDTLIEEKKDDATASTEERGKEETIEHPEEPVIPPEVPPDEPVIPGCAKCKKLFLLAPFILMVFVGMSHGSSFYGSIREGIIASIPIAILCMLHFLIQSRVISYFSKDDETDFGGGIILVSLGILCLAILWAIGFQNCDYELKWWTWIIGFLFVMTVFIRRCWPWFTMLILWLFMVFASFHNPMPNCHPTTLPTNSSDPNQTSSSDSSTIQQPITAPPPVASPNSSSDSSTIQQPITAPPPVAPPINSNTSEDSKKTDPSKLDQFKNNILSTLDNINQTILNKDSDSNKNDPLINQDYGPSQGGRVTLETAIKNPKKYFSCLNAKGMKQPLYDIYIGKDALFDFNSIEITPEGDRYLDKVVQLINSQPNVPIIFTGYSDDIGTERAKMQASRLRSIQLALWLIEHKGVDKDQLFVNGSGDLNPITTQPDLKKLNRRVEMRLDCTKR
jgi:outer membrane protein OmpA-like peptidoglycan-associated protein